MTEYLEIADDYLERAQRTLGEIASGTASLSLAMGQMWHALRAQQEHLRSQLPRVEPEQQTPNPLGMEMTFRSAPPEPEWAGEVSLDDMLRITAPYAGVSPTPGLLPLAYPLVEAQMRALFAAGRASRDVEVAEKDERIAELEAKVAAWEPVVRAAVAFRQSAGQYRLLTGERLIGPVDAIPAEHRPGKT